MAQFCVHNILHSMKNNHKYRGPHHLWSSIIYETVSLYIITIPSHLPFCTWNELLFFYKNSLHQESLLRVLLYVHMHYSMWNLFNTNLWISYETSRDQTKSTLNSFSFLFEAMWIYINKLSCRYKVFFKMYQIPDIYSNPTIKHSIVFINIYSIYIESLRKVFWNFIEVFFYIR